MLPVPLQVPGPALPITPPANVLSAPPLSLKLTPGGRFKWALMLPPVQLNVPVPANPLLPATLPLPAATSKWLLPLSVLVPPPKVSVAAPLTRLVPAPLKLVLPFKKKLPLVNSIREPAAALNVPLLPVPPPPSATRPRAPLSVPLLLKAIPPRGEVNVVLVPLVLMNVPLLMKTGGGPDRKSTRLNSSHA